MFTDNIFLVICGLFFAFILVYFVPPRSYEIGDRDLGGDGGGGSLWEESVIDCDVFVASSSSSLSFSSKTAYSFNSKANEDLSSVDGCTVNKVGVVNIKWEGLVHTYCGNKGVQLKMNFS